MILYKYIAKKFWGPFFFGLGVFAVLVFLADMFDHLNHIMRSSAPLGVVLKYFSLSIPFWTLAVIPVAVLLAALFVLSDMMHNGEWIAAVASGYDPRKLVLPVLLCACAVSLAHFALQETLSAKLHSSARRIMERDIRDNADWDNPVKTNVVLKAGENTLLSAGTLKTGEGLMEKVSVHFSENGDIARQISAQTARWSPEKNRWVFYDGVERTFLQNGMVDDKIFKELDSPIEIAPQKLIIESVWTEDLNIGIIRERIRDLRKIGSSTHREQVYLHSKFTTPFVGIIICMLGIPFAVVVRKANKMLNFTAAIVITFLFWWVLSISQAAGEADMLAPVLAVWTPVALFGAIGAYSIYSLGR